MTNPLPLALALASVIACGAKQLDSETSTQTTSATSSSGPATTEATTSLATEPTGTGSSGPTSASEPQTTGPQTTSGDATTHATHDTHDTTTGSLACGTPPPADCDPNGPTRYCDSGPDCELADSLLYSCQGGVWQPTSGDAQCQADAHDFAFGCVNTGNEVQLVCGDGPGTPCTADDPTFCIDVVTVQNCQHGKLANTDCQKACIAGEVDGVVYEGGYCIQSRIASKCGCCNAPDCP